MRKECKIANTVFLWATVSLLSVSCNRYGYEEDPSIQHQSQTIPLKPMDILFVIDNSGSMAGEQLQLANSFSRFVEVIKSRNSDSDFHIAIVTPGMESEQCPPCYDYGEQSCLNETFENGRFQDRQGKLIGSLESPEFEFSPSDASCRVVHQDNINCLFDPISGRGTSMVGINGCGYERGLSAIHSALSPNLLDSYNSDFLRDGATLAVVVVSDEEDCGQVGDVNEGRTFSSGNACYSASKGEDGLHRTTDPEGKPYRLTSVETTYDFLKGLKPAGMTKFAAIVGVLDRDNPGSTMIEFEPENWSGNFFPVPACAKPGCVGAHCTAYPGTRYIQLAQMFEADGLVDTICQDDFSATMAEIAELVVCPRIVDLPGTFQNMQLTNLAINGVAVPRYSCTVKHQVEECPGPQSDSCSAGTCAPTWTYQPSQELKQENPPAGGRISFASHFDPCAAVTDGKLYLDLTYVAQTR